MRRRASCWGSGKRISAGRSRTCPSPTGRWSCAARSRGVIRDRRPLRLEHQEYHASSTEVLWLTIEIRLLYRPDNNLYGVLLSFSDQTRLHNIQRELQTAQEKLENSIEELQSANEELETTNEELQSTNEELATINEEARSSNEEMEAANEELRLQAEQATDYRVYLEAIQRSLDIGLVVLDQAQLVQTWNRWSESTWGLRAEEVIGTRFSELDIGFPVHVLQEGLISVQSNRVSALEQRVEGVDRRGRRIVCRVKICQLSGTGKASSGLVLAFEDVTELERKDEYARYLGRIAGQSLNEIFFLDPHSLKFLQANEGAKLKLGLSEHQLTQTALTDMMPLVTLEALQQIISPLLTGTKQEVVLESRIRSAAGHEYPVQMCLQYFGKEAPPILFVMAHDTSERQAVAAD